MTLSNEQSEYFKDSVIRGKDGTLLPVYHGTGTNIEAFDPDYTGHGNDQYGSGFYFSTLRSDAEAYVDATIRGDDGRPLPKLGGTDNPTIIEAFLDIRNPLVIDGTKNANLRNVEVSGFDALRILKHMPALYFPIDGDEPNPIGDYFEDVWETMPSTEEEFLPYIHRLVAQHFAPTNLLYLDVFFKDYPTEFRKALHDELGFDGVVVDFGSRAHVIAWFPEQIKDVNNRHPQRGPYIHH